jgi:acetaldehyde dehydrogenase/alcohol dehydrogenase
MRFMDIRKRIEQFPQMNTKAHFIAIPTTAGTGSEVTPFAVITDESTGSKYPLADYQLMPTMAIIDSQLMDNMPPSLTAATGIDALTHALEALASCMASDYTNSLSYQAGKMIFT